MKNSLKKSISGLFAMLASISVLMAQNAFIRTPIPTESTVLFEKDLKVGCGLNDPAAMFHVKSNITLQQGLKIDGYAPGAIGGTLNLVGTIENWSIINGITYGIYQTGSPYFQILNYLQSPLKVGKATLYTDPDLNSGISLDQYEQTFTFSISPNSGSSKRPLIISGNGINVTGKTQTDEFQLLTNPGEGRILLSDAIGNGLWTDVSNLSYHDDDWLPRVASGDAGELMNLYMNDKKYTFVGIGTEYPKSKLHVVDGNIMISRSGLSAPGSTNGSLLFGEIINPQSPSGEWGIEYFHEGLNFKKVPTTGDPGKNNCLFLKNNGNVGIATELPLDRFQVNDGVGKVMIGAGPILYAPGDQGAIAGKSGSVKNPDNPGQTGLGYLGFNMVHNAEGWLSTGDGIYNSYSMIYNSLGGDIFFSSANSSGGTDRQLTQSEVETNTKLTIHQTGNIGIGTRSPDVALDIRRNYNASIQCFTENSHPASIWVRNNLNGYGLVIDNQGTGHISLFGTTPTPIMSFRSGKVDVTGDLGVSNNLSVSGRVGIGAVTLSNYPNSTSKLFVEGGITTEEVHVLLQADWSDFVFSKNYKLRSLSDLEHYIEANKHLPDIPSAATVEKEGIELGKMNALLLQKVEEMTLYILQLEKRMGELEKNRKQ